MVSLYKDRSPAVVVWLFVLSIVVHSHFFIQPPVVIAAEEDGLLSLALRHYFQILHPSAIILTYHVLVLVQAFWLNYLFTDHRMFLRTNYLTAMVFILLTGLFSEWSNITPALISNFMLIWLFGKILKLYSSHNPKALLFNIGLLIGCSIILYHPSTLLILVALFAWLVLRPFKLNELVILFMGVLAPFYFLFSILFLTNRMQRLQQYIPEWQFNLPAPQTTIMFFVTMGVLVLFILMGIYHWQDQSRRVLIQIRKSWMVLLVMLLLLLPLPFVSKNANIDSVLLWIVPIAPFIAKGFIGPKKKTIPALMFWCLLAIAIINTWQLVKK
ncbi:MAG: hypothetical protein JWQ96_2275 [Segetibacter sp.]|nr:hypothetical protein [Segetibacter sp.]